MIPLLSDLAFGIGLLTAPPGIYCELCGKRLKGTGRRSELLCDNCLDRLEALTEHEFSLRACGREFRVFCARPYVKEWRRLMLAYKGGERRLVSVFAEAVAVTLRGAGLTETELPQAVVGIPCTRERLRVRGFNPGCELAKTVAAELGLPYDGKLLRKVRETAHQSAASREERLTRVSNSMAADPDRVKGRHVLIVDDVFTTGSTAAEAARALLEAGAECVTVACAARALMKRSAGRYIRMRGVYKAR